MSSIGGEFGSALIGGIQNVAAFIPLIGTEEVSSSLTRGYLYSASAPISIFGSFGLVVAGFKTFMACFSFRGIEGAKILWNMGVELQGDNLSLIMVETGKEKNAGRYVIDTRIDELIKELNIDQNRIIGVTHKSTAWRVRMIAATAFLCALSITPYIHLNLVANNLMTNAKWIFPVLRAAGGFITTTLIPLLIQRQITILSDKFLVKRDQQRRNGITWVDRVNLLVSRQRGQPSLLLSLFAHFSIPHMALLP